MLLVLLGLSVLIYMVVVGIIQQGPEIMAKIEAGLESLQMEFAQSDAPPPSPEKIEEIFAETLPILFEGFFSFLGNTLSSTISLGISIYFSLFILYFFLRDADTFEAWIATQITLSPQASEDIVTNASQTVLVYFQGTALTAMISAAVVAVPLFALNVPLIGSILILYFFTSFVPYLGAWVGGAFAVLIALGSGGVETALIVLITVIISNGILQTMVSSWALGSMLKLHPLMIFLVTITAGIIGGVLLMVLAVPLTAITLQVTQSLRKEGVFEKSAVSNAPLSGSE
jgi:predicted PurR-regulated permease PerM